MKFYWICCRVSSDIKKIRIPPVKSQLSRLCCVTFIFLWKIQIYPKTNEPIVINSGLLPCVIYITFPHFFSCDNSSRSALVTSSVRSYVTFFDFLIFLLSSSANLQLQFWLRLALILISPTHPTLPPEISWFDYKCEFYVQNWFSLHLISIHKNILKNWGKKLNSSCPDSTTKF